MKKKILIVEDEFVVANDLEIMLGTSGYEPVGIAVSARAAMELIARDIPDLVLLDIQLQGAESGIDLARELRNLHIAFVYLSANSDQKTLQQARATEPYGFLVKPVRPKDLLVTLDIACYRHEHSRESYLFRKEKLLRELTSLVNGGKDPAVAWSGFARLLQAVVPFDLLCFVRWTPADGYEFRGLYRVGFSEYQEIDKDGLANIAARSGRETGKLLSELPGRQEIGHFNGGDYERLLKNDPLALLLDQCYSFLSAIRGSVDVPGAAPCQFYIYSKEPDQFDDRHIAVVTDLKEVIGRLVAISGATTGQTVSTIGGSVVTDAFVEKFVGKSMSIARCLDMVAQVAPLNTSVLITGESGTGKELFAEAIHNLSPRKGQPFIKINSAALPYTLIESELFGYEKGAFTGADSGRMGKFEAASGGTVFLDEIGEMSPDVQVKLLRVLQERKIQRLGSHQVIDTDVRIIAATNRDLAQAVAEHRFRLDLYFRLNVFPIALPPLRERKEDLPLLADLLGKKIAGEMGRIYNGISPAMMEEIKKYHWPGNVRELENVIERALIVSDPNQPLSLREPLILSQPSNPSQLLYGTRERGIGSAGGSDNADGIKQRQEQFERELIENALRETKSKVRGPGGAAERLDIKPTTLESRIIRLGIRKEDFK